MATKWNGGGLANNGPTDFASLLKDEAAVVLLRGKNNFGDLIYCYLKVALQDVDRLQAALKSDASFTASDFGTVVAAGKGEPTPEVKAEIAASYKVLDQAKPFRPPHAVSEAEKKAWDEY